MNSKVVHYLSLLRSGLTSRWKLFLFLYRTYGFSKVSFSKDITIIISSNISEVLSGANQPVTYERQIVAVG